MVALAETACVTLTGHAHAIQDFLPRTVISVRTVAVSYVKTSWPWNAFCITGPLCGESTVHGWIPIRRGVVMWSFHFFSLNMLLSKQAKLPVTDTRVSLKLLCPFRICTLFGCAMLCCGYIIRPLSRPMWHIYPYLSRLLKWYSLQWRHNGRDGVSNHQPFDCLLDGLFRRRSKKTPKLPRHWLFVWGIHRWPVNSPHKGPVTRKMFPFDDAIGEAVV